MKHKQNNHALLLQRTEQAQEWLKRAIEVTPTVIMVLAVIGLVAVLRIAIRTLIKV